jgi:hypothetical protein
MFITSALYSHHCSFRIAVASTSNHFSRYIITFNLKVGDGEGTDGPGGIARDKMVAKWHFGKEELCNIL